MRTILISMLVSFMMTASAAWGKDAMYFYNRGVESSMANKRIEYFTKAIQLNPKLAEAYEKRALHYYYQWKYDKAIQDYTRVIELLPESAEAHRMRGVSHLKKGELERAISDFSRAVEIDPKLASAYGYRAEALRLMGMIEEALVDSTKAIHLKGDQRTIATAYRTRAKAHKELGHVEQSDADFDKSFELDPRYALVRYLASTASLESVRRMGLFGIIAILFITIFHVSLSVPKKKDES